MRCWEIWSSNYPLESFKNEASSDLNDSGTESYPIVSLEDLKALAIDTYMQRVATQSETMMEKEFEETYVVNSG
ncbi:hypothetical protein RJT34_07124 [Clitoria ternatea]|uniref:Uncharacterized protein n=1 Tax=Clitoria ternatea TaxID=43366 RepID=A0AAN9K4S6_CLITE